MKRIGWFVCGRLPLERASGRIGVEALEQRDAEFADYAD